MARRIRVGRYWRVLAVAVALLALPLPAVQAQSVRLTACKKVIPRGSVYGSELLMQACGNRFSTEDRYIAIVTHLQQVRDQIQVGIEILDPQENSVWASRPTFKPDPGYYYADLWIWQLLAVAAEPKSLAEENPLLVLHMVPLRGRPARERVGEWTLRVSLNGGSPRIMKFRLEAAPGTVPSPTPTPQPAPAESPTPTPSPTASP